MKSPSADAVLFVLVLYGYVLAIVMESSWPLPIKIIVGLAGVLIAAWSCAQAIEYFWGKYKQFGPGILTALQHSWLESPWKSTLWVAVLFGVFFGICTAIVFYTWGHFQSQRKQVERPDIAPKIQVDSVKAPVCRFHIELENGEYWANNIRVDSQSELFERSDRVPKSMAPGRKLSLPGSYFNLPVGRDDTLTVRIYFDATIGGVTKHLIQEHQFPLSPQALNLRTIEPSSNRYDDGLPPTPRLLGTPFLAEQFAKDEHTIVFPAPEIYEGKPLVFGAKNDSRTRKFAYRAEEPGRGVFFSTVTKNGRVIELFQPLPERRNSDHIIGISWNPLGGSLTVDGKTIQDYDDRPRQPLSTPNTEASPH